MTRQWTTYSRVTLAVIFSVLAVMTLHARQRDGAPDLRDRLRGRYDIVALQNGVALVPRQQNPAVRIIEIRNGAVAINGDEVTGRQLREQLAGDADVILQISYMNPAEQRTLATSVATPAPAPLPSDAPPAVVAEPPVQADRGARRTRRGGDNVRFMGDVTVARDEQVQGNVVAVMGSATIDGEVDGDLTVVLGTATLGTQSVVTGDVHVVGGALNRAAGSRVDGAIHNVTSGRRTWSSGDTPNPLRSGFFGRLGSLAGTLIRVALLALLALVVVAFGRRSVERVADRAAADPVRAGLVGFAAQILFFPVLVLTVILLAISIVGIPLLVLVPFGVVLAVIVMVVGFTGVAYHVGRLLNGRFGWTGRNEYVTVLLGVVTIAAVTLLARSVALVAGGMLGWPLSAVGFVIEYAAWTLGLGAAILMFRGRQTLSPPPPIPA